MMNPRVCAWKSTRIATALLAVMCLSQPLLAAETDPIDEALRACLSDEKGQSTAGMVECTGTATAAWNARLNEVYKKAMTGLDPKSRGALRAAQRRWLAFREAEQAAQAAPWSAERGSVIRVVVMGANLAAIRGRAEELRIYLP